MGTGQGFDQDIKRLPPSLVSWLAGRDSVVGHLGTPFLKKRDAENAVIKSQFQKSFEGIEMFDKFADTGSLLPAIVGTVILLLGAIGTYFLARYLLTFIVHGAVRRTTTRLDDALIDNKVFSRLAHIVPALVITNGITLVPGISNTVETATITACNVYMIIIVTLTLTSVLTAINQIYELTPASRNKPIKGFIQLAQLAIVIIGGIFVVSTLIDRSPVILLSGLGAITAVLMVIFKDTLLSLAASIQLTSQELIRVGDWLEAPQFGADGDVIDVALYTVTVQNWDKTISTIPTHQLVGGSFKNWRGMSESGGRRIKRSISIDMNSIRFLTDEEVERLKNVDRLNSYILAKQEELQAYNTRSENLSEPWLNQRHLTNIGTLRAYIRSYLHNHSKVHQDMTWIVVKKTAPSLPPADIQDIRRWRLELTG